MVIDAFVGWVNEPPPMLFISVNNHLDDSPLAIMQDSGLEVLVVEKHSAVIVEKINSSIVVREYGVQHGATCCLIRSPWYFYTPFQETMDEFYLGLTP